MMSKLINDLINYYKLTEYYDEFEDSEELNEFQNNISKIIEENITIFKILELDLTKVDILEKKINILYKEIILSLIKLKFNDNTIDIFNQLDLENIILNKPIVDELWETLISQNFKDYFNINNFNDLFNSQRINFFYIIFKYIFKSDFYAIKKELFELRKNIAIFSSDKKKEIFFSEYNKLNYFLKKQIFFIIKSLLTINRIKYYMIFLMAIKDKDPYLLLDNSYLKYSMNIKKENESPFDNFEFTIIKEKYPEIPKDIKDSVPELITFMNDFKEKIEKKYNNNKYKLIITLKLNIVGDIKDLVGKPYNINCVYELEKLGLDSDKGNKVKKYKDENILVNGLSEGFEFLIEEINDESYNKKNNNT